MDDSLPVQEFEGGGNALEQAYTVLQRQRTAAEALEQVFAVEPLHGEEAAAAVVLAVGHVGDDARVVKLREQLRLAREALHRVCTSRVMAQQLQRYLAAAVPIARPVDAAH